MEEMELRNEQIVFLTKMEEEQEDVEFISLHKCIKNTSTGLPWWRSG